MLWRAVYEVVLRPIGFAIFLLICANYLYCVWHIRPHTYLLNLVWLILGGLKVWWFFHFTRENGKPFEPICQAYFQD